MIKYQIIQLCTHLDSNLDILTLLYKLFNWKHIPIVVLH